MKKAKFKPSDIIEFYSYNNRKLVDRIHAVYIDEDGVCSYSLEHYDDCYTSDSSIIRMVEDGGGQDIVAHPSKYLKNQNVKYLRNGFEHEGIVLGIQWVFRPNQRLIEYDIEGAFDQIKEEHIICQKLDTPTTKQPEKSYERFSLKLLKTDPEYIKHGKR